LSDVVVVDCFNPRSLDEEGGSGSKVGSRWFFKKYYTEFIFVFLE